jgi:hypothetical protein
VSNFEVFDRSLTSTTREPAVTVQKRGTMSMNRAAYEALRRPDAVELLFDATARTIGLRPVAPAADNAHLVRRPARSTSGPFTIAALPFLQFYRLRLDESRRWPAFLDGDVLCVDLRAESRPASRTRLAQ